MNATVTTYTNAIDDECTLTITLRFRPFDVFRDPHQLAYVRQLMEGWKVMDEPTRLRRLADVLAEAKP